MIPQVDRDLVLEAERLEQRRIEIYASAVERRVADLMPRAWSDLTGEMEDPVEIVLLTVIREEEIDAWTERELRNFTRFIAQLADQARAERRRVDDPEDAPG